MRKSCLGISLYVILLAPALMAWGWLKYERVVARQEAKLSILQGLGKNELVLLKFPKQSTAYRFEGSTELEYNNEMFDIVSTEVRGDSVYFWCWKDEAETQINEAVVCLLKRTFDDDPKQKAQQDRLFSYLKSLYHKQPAVWQCIGPATGEFSAAPFETYLPSPEFSPPVPPPELI